MSTPYSRLAINVLTVLVKRGYVRGMQLVKPASVRAPPHDMLEVYLNYDAHRKTQHTGPPTLCLDPDSKFYASTHLPCVEEIMALTKKRNADFDDEAIERKVAGMIDDANKNKFNFKLTDMLE